MIAGRMFGDPGCCPVDDTPHTACVAPAAAIVVVQLPARDGLTTPRGPTTIPAGATPGSITTATYRRDASRPFGGYPR
jgi:hypothetical protein